MAQDTAALAGALGIHTFDLMGWSMSGEIAQRVTVDAPSHVLKLVLCATGAGGPTEKLPSAPVQELMSEPDLPTAKLLALSFPPTPAGTRAPPTSPRRWQLSTNLRMARGPFSHNHHIFLKRSSNIGHKPQLRISVDP